MGKLCKQYDSQENSHAVLSNYPICSSGSSIGSAGAKTSGTAIDGDLLAGAGIEVSRFLLNTTVSLAGFFDVATSRFDLKPSKEDFGQTLGFYGMGGLMYIVWPFLGPSNVRDTIGFAGDSFLDPVNYVNPFEAAMGIQAYERINTRSLEIGTYEDMNKSAIDPYIAIRDAYVQYRNAQIKK